MIEKSLQLWTKDNDLLNRTRENTVWVVNYYGGVKIYLTEEEKKFFFEKLTDGAKYVQIKEQILTGDFSTVVFKSPTKLDSEELLKEAGYKLWKEGE